MRCGDIGGVFRKCLYAEIDKGEKITVRRGVPK